MFNEALRHCQRLAKHDCLVCIVSDGFGHDEDSRKLLTLIAQHNDVLFGFVYDPLEVAFQRPVRSSLATARQLQVDTDNRGLREDFRDTFAEDAPPAACSFSNVRPRSFR